MKKLLAITILATTLFSQNVFADNCDDLVKKWKNLFATIQGKTYDAPLTRTVTTPEQWKVAIEDAYNNLNDSITLQIAGFNNEDYDINLLKNHNVSISAKGYVSHNEFSKVTYNFTYNSNFKIAQAIDNKNLYKKLNIQEKEAYNILNQATQTLTNSLETDYEKELAIHNFITDNFKYGPLEMSEVPARAHTVTGFLIDGQGICEAYANTFLIMGKFAGLDVSIITGTTNNINHMWNLIKLDGNYYHVDVSSDDPSPDVPNRERYNFFNVPDDIMSRTHAWERKDFPSCTSYDYNYYTLNNYIVHNEQELSEFINNKLSNNETYFTFRTEGYAIPNVEVIKRYVKDRGFYSVNISGEYGKESTYNITFK